MSEKVYPYNAEAQLNDGTFELLDLEEHGWADPVRLSKVVRWSLVPKGNAEPPMGGGDWPVVVVTIPEGAKPVFKARAYGTIAVASDATGGVLFRCYAIGWKKGSEERLVWVLPTGDIDFSDDPLLADAILRNMTMNKE